jgi:hypothetical protein
MDLSKSEENYTTMRSLLGLIRLAQARVHMNWFRRDSDSQMKLQERTSLIALKSYKRARSVLCNKKTVKWWYLIYLVVFLH